MIHDALAAVSVGATPDPDPRLSVWTWRAEERDRPAAVHAEDGEGKRLGHGVESLTAARGASSHQRSSACPWDNIRLGQHFRGITQWDNKVWNWTDFHGI
jgi:hypothetical protein